MKNRKTYNLRWCAPLLLAAILVVLQPACLLQAAVGDNIETAVIEQTIGTWEDASDAHSVIGLLRLIIEKITTQLEKLDALETKVNAIDTKMDEQTASIQNSIENMGQAANASYCLYVYLPKSSALSDYSGQQVKITASSGNQSATATLRDDGTNYSTTLYFGFCGNCQLSYNLLNKNGKQIAAIEPVTITATGQELKIKTDPENMTWYTIHNICQAKSTAMFGLTTDGTELPDSWFVIGSGTADDGADALRIWRKTDAGGGDWSSAYNKALTYYNTFNLQFGDCAYKSGLLTSTEIWTGWLNNENNRTTGFSYWLGVEDAFTGDTYRRPCVTSEGDVTSVVASQSSCAFCPYVWIH